MARARNIKPAIMDNEDLADLEPLTRLLFVYLWMLADREGRLEDRPKRIAAQALPYDRTADVGAMLVELCNYGFIARYEAAGQKVIQITGFSKHQTPHGTEKDSDLPGVDALFSVHVRGKNGYSTGIIQLRGIDGTVIKQSDDKSLTVKEHPDSLIPDSLIPDSGLKDSTARAPAPAKPKRTRKEASIPLPDDFCISDQVREWAEKNGVQHLERHFESFIDKVKAKGYVYANWDAALRNAITDDWAKLRIDQQPRASPPPQQSRHAGFDQKNYGEGIGSDGRIN